ncbi:hypothetical protein NKH34_25020 [Mesorhizobium sp. M1148]|uniref:hypothetical protein n=1 Tax=unclassified Mesorhizobium TaxID=325217 RepID=UPI00333CCED8
MTTNQIEHGFGLVANNDNCFAWNRCDHLHSEFRFYTSPDTIKVGRRVAAVSNNYSTRGKPCTWPVEPGNWLTSKSCRTATKKKEEPADWDVWIGARQAPTIVKTATSVVTLPNDAPRPGHIKTVAAATGRYDDALRGTRISRDLAGTEAGATLDVVSELLRPASLVAANDNFAQNADDETVNGGWGLETKLTASSIRPSIPAFLAAYSDGLRPRVTVKSDGTIVRFAGGVRYDSRKNKRGITVKELIEIGGRDSAGKFRGLQFYEGELIAYGQNGVRKRPWVDATEASQARHSSEDEHEAAQLAEEQSVAAGYLALGKQTAAMPYLYGQLAGITEGKGVGVGKTSAPAHMTLSEIDRAIDAADFVARVPDRVMSIVTAANDDETYAKIAIDRGYAKSSASKVGKKLVLKALSEIKSAIAA